MSKLKQPVISLEAHGTIGGSLTLKRRRGKDLAVRKPIPTYRRTLPQQYQRWDYQDGIAYWNTLTPAQKQTYKSGGAKHHMTGFAYFMSYYLSKLPDLAGRWRLDEKAGNVAYDSSKNANHGTIFGASPATGLIDGARDFDGIDNYIRVTNSSSLAFTGDFTCLLFCNLPDPGANYYFVIGRQNTVWELALTGPGAGNRLELRIGGVAFFFTNSMIGHWGKPVHLALSWQDDIDTAIFYINGDPVGSLVNATTIPVSNEDLYIGRRKALAWGWLNGWLDHIEIVTQVLTPQVIKAHAERRYP